MEDTNLRVVEVIGFRCPRPSSTNFSLGGLRIDFHALNTTALLSLGTEAETQSFHQRLINNPSLLGVHPFYLLLFIFQERFGTWGEWFTRQWKVLTDVEFATGMTAKEWMLRRADYSMDQPPKSTKVLLEMVHAAHAELSHVETVMKSAKRFGDGAICAIQHLEETREMLGLPTLKKKERGDLVNRMKYVVSRCEAIDDTLPELKEQLDGQINVVFGLIAQRDSRSSVTMAERQILISELAAQDSRVMRIIGILTLLFLPTTLVTVCVRMISTTSLVDLDPLINWVAWLSASVGLTVVVTGCLWQYDRQTAGKRQSQQLKEDNAICTCTMLLEGSQVLRGAN
ncbi:hypothetical protein C8A03DRAFT_19992 [Achaetomium macrosporum]|uniref:Mg2+ transporter protein, CorA-like/Zinc transport protein ZntB n=1 Tax=Achaetomium macrosporum TaxID=79813 RepID=A0AAN7H9E7_9PEZI|nr:hypothetical protein C8A03DRAFT_19992 [Achaetomium macrosporum]